MLVDRSTVSGNQALAGGGDSGGIQNFGDGEIHHGALTIRNSTITGEHGAPRRRRSSAGTTRPTPPWSRTARSRSTRRPTAASAGSAATGRSRSPARSWPATSSASAPSNCSGTIVSLGSNLESGTDCGFTAAGDLRSTDPALRPLGDNGGPTDTLALPPRARPSTRSPATARRRRWISAASSARRAPRATSARSSSSRRPCRRGRRPDRGDARERSRRRSTGAAPSDGGTPITRLPRLPRHEPGRRDAADAIGNVTSYTDTTAANGTTYFYKVSAVNGVGEGALLERALGHAGDRARRADARLGDRRQRQRRARLERARVERRRGDHRLQGLPRHERAAARRC